MMMIVIIFISIIIIINDDHHYQRRCLQNARSSVFRWASTQITLARDASETIGEFTGSRKTKVSELLTPKNFWVKEKSKNFKAQEKTVTEVFLQKKILGMGKVKLFSFSFFRMGTVYVLSFSFFVFSVRKKHPVFVHIEWMKPMDQDREKLEEKLQ